MSKRLPTPTWAKKSPWLDPAKNNLFQYEFQLARENLPFRQFKPMEIYRWIWRQGGEGLLFRGLARLAPMFPLMAYHGEVAVWTSPPPSGLGNAIYLVMGHDKNGLLRLVGGNYFTEPARQSGSPMASEAFFAHFDLASQHDQFQLVKDTVQASIQSHDEDFLLDIRRECEHFHTMAIYITVLTDRGSMFHAGKAVIEGMRPANFSYELFGEVK